MPPEAALVYYLILLSYCQVALDYGILGSSEFVQGLLSEVDEREKETLRLSSKIKSLSSLARSIEKDERITGLRSGSRTRKVSKACQGE